MKARRPVKRSATRSLSPLAGHLATLRSSHDRVTDLQGPLVALRGLVTLELAAASTKRAAVELARSSGVSWAEIGYALGISKQAAQQRYGAAVNSR